MFAFDGSVRICPVENRPAENMQIENAHLQKKVFSVKINGDSYTASYNGTRQTAVVGETITI
ncbi:MAG: hypothetical protein IJZ56_05710 [Oscillospiraceae bacterium]|nr:hypothetical protein [Oscillospiraceae bacterium]